MVSPDINVWSLSHVNSYFLTYWSHFFLCQKVSKTYVYQKLVQVHDVWVYVCCAKFCTTCARVFVHGVCEFEHVGCLLNSRDGLSCLASTFGFDSRAWLGWSSFLQGHKIYKKFFSRKNRLFGPELHYLVILKPKICDILVISGGITKNRFLADFPLGGLVYKKSGQIYFSP